MNDLEHFMSAPSSPSPSGEDLCALCARDGTCCCKTDPDLTYLSFPLSGPEWLRLLPHAELASREPFGRPAGAPPAPAFFADYFPGGGDRCAAPEPNRREFVESMLALFPGEKARILVLFPEGKEHFALRTRADGSCVFLGENGCRLPRAARPWYCLLFPAWLAKGGLTLFKSSGCLISGRARSVSHGLALLGAHPATVRRLHAALCRDWGLKREA